MFIELVDSLRCLKPHEDSWLVAAVERFEGRFIDRGSLGCPVCHAQYRIERGAVDFRPPDAAGERPADDLVEAPGGEEVLRARALLNLTGGGGTIVLTGAAAAFASPLEDETEVNVLLVNPPRVTEQQAGRSTLLVDGRVPLARGSVRGALLGEDQSGGAIIADLAHALRAGGRLVAPVAAPLPAGLHELARDGRQWVAEKREGAPGLVTIGTRR